MRAVRYHEAGDPSVLQIDEIETPTPGSGEILVDIRAASINPTDAKRRRRGTGPCPKTTGSDFAGVVESVGTDLTEFAAGDRVCGTGLHTTRFHQGSFADAVAVPTDVVTHLPEDVSFEDGAAVALVGVTAWRALIDHGGLVPTEAVLVHGGSGGVGHIAVQLAAHIGAHTVATAGSPESQRATEAFGADAVFDYARNDLLEAVAAATDSGFDVILDHRVPDYFELDVEAAAFDGRVILYSGKGGQFENLGVGMAKNLTVHMMTMSNLANDEDLPTIASVLRRVLDLTARDVLRPVIARTYDLEEAVEVHRSILEDSFVGKLVVVP